MAALRIFPCTLLFRCPQHCTTIINPWSSSTISINNVNRRWASFKASPTYDESRKYTDFEISNNIKEWMFVERCFKPKYIPVPPKDTDNLPSGWTSQKSEVHNFPYFIERNKNHLQPVYLHRKNRGIRRLTLIKKIQGDIITLERDVRTYLEKSTGKKIGAQILEPSGVIKFRGDYVSLVKRWLTDKGF